MSEFDVSELVRRAFKSPEITADLLLHRCIEVTFGDDGLAFTNVTSCAACSKHEQSWQLLCVRFAPVMIRYGFNTEEGWREAAELERETGSEYKMTFTTLGDFTTDHVYYNTETDSWTTSIEPLLSNKRLWLHDAEKAKALTEQGKDDPLADHVPNVLMPTEIEITGLTVRLV